MFPFLQYKLHPVIKGPQQKRKKRWFTCHRKKDLVQNGDLKGCGKELERLCGKELDFQKE
jgi:hypothetical protein